MKQFHDDVLEVIRKTREISLPGFGVAEVLKKKTEHGYDVVTEVDRRVETFLTSEFSKIDSTIEFVGEEFGGSRDAKKFWLVDPVDGTGLYIRGLSGCTTMVALIEGGEVTFGAIYDFVTDTMYHAVKARGAFANDKKISVSDRGIGSAYIGYESRIEKAENLEIYLKIKKGCSPIKYMSAGYEYAFTAMGKLDGRIVIDGYGFDYDFAAGSLLVQEAGGVVTNIGSDAYDYRNLNHIAANPVLHKELTTGPSALFPASSQV